MQETEYIAPKLDIKRGLKWAMISAIYGSLGAGLGLFIMVPYLDPSRFCYTGTCTMDQAYSIKRFIFALLFGWAMVPGPLIVLLFACSGWACSAPQGKYNFTLTLIIIICITVPIAFVVFILSGIIMISMRCTIYDNIGIILTLIPTVLPPIIASYLLTTLRAANPNTPN